MNIDQGNELLRQIGAKTIMAVSGGRKALTADGRLDLPAGSSYHVVVTLEPNDTYTVERVWARSGKLTVKGRVTDVYCEEISDTVWRASCYVNVDFGGHKP